MTKSVPDDIVDALLSSTSVDAIESVFSRDKTLLSRLTPDVMGAFANREDAPLLHKVAVPILVGFLSQAREEGLNDATAALTERLQEVVRFADLPFWGFRFEFVSESSTAIRTRMIESLDWMLAAWANDRLDMISLLSDCRDLIAIAETSGLGVARSHLFDEATARNGILWLMPTAPWERDEYDLRTHLSIFANASTEIVLEQLLGEDPTPEHRRDFAKLATFVRMCRILGVGKTLDSWKTIKVINEIYSISMEDETGELLSNWIQSARRDFRSMTRTSLRLWAEIIHWSLPSDSIAVFASSLLDMAKIVGHSQFEEVEGALNLAIEVCGIAESYHPRATAPDSWVDIVTWKAHCIIIKSHDKSRRQLQSAIRMLEDCLEVVNVEESPMAFAVAKYLLGSAALAGGEFGESRFEVATSALQDALGAIDMEQNLPFCIDVLHQSGLASLGWAKKLMKDESARDRCVQQLGIAIASLESAVGAAYQAERQEIIPAIALKVAETYFILAAYHPKEALDALWTWCNAGLNSATQQKDTIHWAQFHLVLARARWLCDAENASLIQEHLDNALLILQPGDFPEECFHAGSIGAQSAYAQGNFTLALEYGEIALASWESRFANESWREKKEAMLEEMESVTTLVVDCCTRLSADPALARQALCFADAAKSRILNDQLSLFGQPHDSEIQKLVDELRYLEEQRSSADVVFSDRTRFGDPLENPMLHDVAALIQERRERLEDLRNRRARMRHLEETRAWSDPSIREGGFLDDPLENSVYGFWADKCREGMTDYRGPTSSLQVTRMQEKQGDTVSTSSDWSFIKSILDKLPPDTLVAEFFNMESEVLLFLARQDWVAPKVIRTHISRAALKERYLIPFMRDILSGNQPAPDSGWAQLGDLLFAEAREDILEARLLYLVPHGELHRVPLHALKIGGRFLIELTPVCYIPALSVLTRIIFTGGVDRSAKTPIALVMGYTSSAREERTFYREAEFLGKKLNAEVLLGDAASREALKTHAHEAYLIHISCHGSFDRINPLQSCIYLSDGRFFGDHWIGLDLDAELVTLSCCQSGTAEIRTGDEVTGLTRALLIAGARSAILTLWSVPAASTALWMEFFYDNAVEVGDKRLYRKANAFQKATVKLIEEGYPPIAWAPFVIVGAS
jgi:CHAT domain-containing protein